jgi:long-chain acyl-CoA synthetase
MPRRHCLGWRPYDPRTKSFGQFTWMDYQTVQRRRAAFGVGLVELHKKHGCPYEKHGVGLWCQNRPEWQITGMSKKDEKKEREWTDHGFKNLCFLSVRQDDG